MANLIYFDGRGRGEIVRLALAAAGIQFTEDFSRTREHFLKAFDDGKLLFKQLPVLEIDGMILAQTSAIVRYVGRKGGLCGKDEKEAALIDMYYEGARDLMTPTLPIGFKPEKVVLDMCKATILPKYLPIFNKIAEDNGSGYLVGSSLTLADVSLVEPLLVYVEYLGMEILDDYPALKKFYDTVKAHPNISAYLKGLQRKSKNDDRYISEVKTSLAWSGAL